MKRTRLAAVLKTTVHTGLAAGLVAASLSFSGTSAVFGQTPMPSVLPPTQPTLNQALTTSQRSKLRELTRAEKRNIQTAGNLATGLVNQSRASFQRAEISLSEYADRLAIARRIQSTNSGLLENPAILQQSLRDQSGLMTEAANRYREFNQPGSRAWKSSILQAQLLSAHAELSLAKSLKQDNLAAVLSRSTASLARQHWEMRLADYRIGNASVDELARAAAAMSTFDGTPATMQGDNSGNLLTVSEYRTVLATMQEMVTRWANSTANMGTQELAPVKTSGEDSLPQTFLGVNNTGLAPANQSPKLISFKELTARNATRTNPLQFSEFQPRVIAFSGVAGGPEMKTAGIGRADHLLKSQFEFAKAQGILLHAIENSDAAAASFDQSALLAGRLFESRLGLMLNGNGDLAELSMAWAAGQSMNFGMQDLELETAQGNLDLQTTSLQRLLELAGSTTDTRGSVESGMTLINGLNSFNQLQQLQAERLAEGLENQTRSRASQNNGNGPIGNNSAVGRGAVPENSPTGIEEFRGTKKRKTNRSPRVFDFLPKNPTPESNPNSEKND